MEDGETALDVTARNQGAGGEIPNTNPESIRESFRGKHQKNPKKRNQGAGGVVAVGCSAVEGREMGGVLIVLSQ